MAIRPDQVRPFRQELAYALLAIAGLKLAVLILDANPRFFLWDSVTFIRGALDWELPRDRSMLYSLIIEAIAVPAHSLHALVIAQSVAGMASALLVFGMLRRLLDVRFGIALAAALALALEPSQLFYERMLLAECFGGLAWLGFVALVLAYCRDGRIFWLPLVALAGILAVSFRLNPTLTVIAVGGFLPLWRALFVRHAGAGGESWLRRAKPVALHLALALACTGALHVGYRHLIGHFAHSPPGYIGVEGLFRLGFDAPLVEARHFEGTGCPSDILDRLKLPLKDPTNREGQLWGTDGLWPMMQRECPEPERAADVVSARAIHDRPFAIFGMAFATVIDYFNDGESTWRMDADIGRKGMIPLELIEPARTHFFLDASDFFWTDSLTLLWFKHSRVWLTACFLLVPILAALAGLRFGRGGARPPALLGLALIAAWIFPSQLFFSHIISYRYLHPFPPLALMFAAVLIERARRRAA